MQSLLRSIVVAALLATALGLLSCSKDQTTAPPTARDPVSQEEADDLMVQVGEMMALDNSGWLKELTATVEGTAGLDPPVRPESDSGRPSWATLRDTSFTENMMDYTFNYNYVSRHPVTGELQDHFDWVPGVFLVEGLVTAGSNIVSSEYNTMPSGFYRHRGDFTADFESIANHVDFDGFSEDSSLAFVFSAFRPDSAFWFMDNFFDYESVALNRNLSPYPVTGLVDMALDAFQLNGTDITNFSNHVEAVCTIIFNGTVNARATIQDDFDPPEGVYMYDINIQTGAITRVP